MLKKFMEIVKDEEGATMVEYALMVALIAVVALVTVGPLGQKIQDLFGGVDTAIEVP
jgi:pilus assembly protein Flp/PilA